MHDRAIPRKNPAKQKGLFDKKVSELRVVDWSPTEDDFPKSRAVLCDKAYECFLVWFGQYSCERSISTAIFQALRKDQMGRSLQT